MTYNRRNYGGYVDNCRLFNLLLKFRRSWSKLSQAAEGQVERPLTLPPIFEDWVKQRRLTPFAFSLSIYLPWNRDDAQRSIQAGRVRPPMPDPDQEALTPNTSSLDITPTACPWLFKPPTTVIIMYSAIPKCLRTTSSSLLYDEIRRCYITFSWEGQIFFNSEQR
ncbi:hypothetical protein BJX61DRAFT_541970 [Aspergillus egyptiacus]|nr:hypothetical protein BJX61DRAFT_541970 [Aspergillus egyptiacus]